MQTLTKLANRKQYFGHNRASSFLRAQGGWGSKLSGGEQCAKCILGDFLKLIFPRIQIPAVVLLANTLRSTNDKILNKM